MSLISIFSGARPPQQAAERPSLMERIAQARLDDMVDVKGLAEDIGITAYAADLPAWQAGEMELVGGKWRAIHNVNHSFTRQRFTIAHQIGHFFYHRDLMSRRDGVQGVVDDRSYRQIEAHRLTNPAVLPSHDSQANQFAVQLIMPQDTIKRMLAEGDNVFQIAARTGVAVQAMAIRLRTLN